MLVNTNFSDETHFAIKTALLAGKLLKKKFLSQIKIFTKTGYQNLVTEADFASEKLILSLIKKKFSRDAVIAEESGISKGNHNTWYVDPLDGTVNYAHGVPIFTVSIALYKQKNPFLGVIYQPMTDELFVCEKDRGAFFNGKKISVSNIEQIKKSFLVTGFPYDLPKRPKKIIEPFIGLSWQGVPIRRLGSAALDLAYVAAGKFDGFWETGLGAWDVAAGALMVMEAGGAVTSWTGKTLQLKKPCTILATNGKIHGHMIQNLKDVL